MSRTGSRCAAVALCLLAGPAAAAGLFEQGDVIVADRGNQAYLRYSPATGATDVISSPTVGEGTLSFTAFEPALGPDDALYQQRWPHLLRIDPRTGSRTLIEDATRPVGQLTIHSTVHSHFSRELYAGEDDDVWRLHIDGSPPELLAAATDVGGSNRELLVGPDAFYLLGITPFSFISEIVEVPFAGGPPRQWAETVPSVRDFARMQDGTLYVLDLGPPGDRVVHASIRRVEAGGQYGDEVLVSGPLRGSGPQLGTEAQTPQVLMAAHAGFLYVTTDGNPGLMYRVDVATGGRELVLSSPGENDRGLVAGFVVWPNDVPRDDDGDGVADGFDNCPGIPNPLQVDTDGDAIGDLCNVDRDGDEWGDDVDNCPDAPNPGQEDFDGNGVGDACNGFEDPDGDEIADDVDNCPADANPGQEDFDGNGVGDVCNDFEDRDGDDIADDLDGCPDDFDPTRADTDGDGVENACDPFPEEPDNAKAQCFVDLAACIDLPKFIDEDGDGEHDPTDACPGTPAGAAVDAAGCSHAQFCGRIAPRGWMGRVRCLGADWRNDEIGWPHDCHHRKENGGRACLPR